LELREKRQQGKRKGRKGGKTRNEEKKSPEENIGRVRLGEGSEDI